MSVKVRHVYCYVFIQVSSADYQGTQFWLSSGPTIRRAWSWSKMFDTLMVFLKEFSKKKWIRWREIYNVYLLVSKISTHTNNDQLAWASPHSDQSLRSPHEVSADLIYPLSAHRILTPTRLDLSLRSCVGFVIIWHEKSCLRDLRTTQAQTSLRIRADWSAPLLFAFWKVTYVNLLQVKSRFSS